MKKVLAFVLAIAMVLSLVTVSFAYEGDYLKEKGIEGKIDVLANVAGTLYCDPDASSDGEDNNERDLETLLTDGIIAARITEGASDYVDDRIHLNCAIAPDGNTAPSVEFDGVEGAFLYAVEFKGLDKVNVDTFYVVYSGQQDDNFSGRSIPTNHCDKDVTFLVSTDGGKTYEIAYTTDGTATFVDKFAEENIEENNETYTLRQCTFTCEKTFTGVTNIVYCSNNGRRANNGWPARISEVSAFGPEGTLDKDPKALHGASFDTIYVNDVMNFGEADGSASDKLDAHNRTVDGSDGSVQTIRVRGWIGFEQEIDQFGYQIDDKAPVYGDNFKINAEDIVKEDRHGGAYASRFEVSIPVADIQGTHTIVAVVKLADGSVRKIDKDITATGLGTTPNTEFTYIGTPVPEAQLHGASFDSFVVDGVINFGEADGKASEKLDGHNRTVDSADGSVKQITLRGWIGFESALDKFGYKINDNEPVFGDFAVSPEPAVVADENGGQYASRFGIVIPVAELKGTNTIVAVVKLASGTIVEIDENVTANGAGTTPNTKFTFVGPEGEAPAADVTPITGAIYAEGKINGSPDVWIGNGNAESESVTFVTGKGFDKITFPASWGPNGDFQIEFKVEQNGKEVAKKVETLNTNPGAITVDFGTYIPAGETKLTITLANGATYFVLTSITEFAADQNALTYEASAPFAFGLEFAEAPATEPAPVTEAPQTGDASIMAIAMVAVIALAAVVIIRKKVTE